MALNDALTGLPNRRNFNERLDYEISLAAASQKQFAVIGLDLNRFKAINGLRGHSAGDAVLRILARRMLELIGEGEFVARLGGDEFAAIKHFEDKADLMAFLGRLEEVLVEKIQIDDFE